MNITTVTISTPNITFQLNANVNVPPDTTFNPAQVVTSIDEVLDILEFTATGIKALQAKFNNETH